jgi:hypothetical protein
MLLATLFFLVAALVVAGLILLVLRLTKRI